MTSLARRARSFAVRGVLWRKYLDWAVENLPFYFYPFLIFFCTVFFYIVAWPARRALRRNLQLSNSGSSLRREFATFKNFAWTISEAAMPRVNDAPFHYDLIGAEHLQTLANANGAIVITAHMGSYDLGAALFAEKFQRELRMVRAREADEQSAAHVDSTLRAASSGGIKLAYNTGDAALSFDLLSAIRSGEIVSLQGDRVIGGGSVGVTLFGKPVRLPAGPFNLALITGAPAYPLFIARAGFRRYAVITYAPLKTERTNRGRECDAAAVAQQWAAAFEQTVSEFPNQWYAFAPIW